MNKTIESFLTSDEIGALTQTAHELVLERACEQLVKAGIDPNKFWNDYIDLETGVPGKRLHLPKKECLLVIGNEWFSEKAKSRVMKVCNSWEQQDKIILIADIEKKLIMSPTLALLHELAQTLPTNVHNTEDLKAAFSTCGIGLIEAIDNNRILFSSEIDKATLLALLTVTVDFILDGRLKDTSSKDALH